MTGILIVNFQCNVTSLSPPLDLSNVTLGRELFALTPPLSVSRAKKAPYIPLLIF